MFKYGQYFKKEINLFCINQVMVGLKMLLKNEQFIKSNSRYPNFIKNFHLAYCFKWMKRAMGISPALAIAFY